MTKMCRGCGATKPTDQFARYARNKDGLDNCCRTCTSAKAREWRRQNPERSREYDRRGYRKWRDSLTEEEWAQYLAASREGYHANREAHSTFNRKARLRAYGLVIEEYDALLERQNGVCAICDQPETVVDRRTKKPVRLAVDHCHETGAVRGLLCKSCNLALGKLGDSLEVAKRLVAYLEGARQ